MSPADLPAIGPGEMPAVIDAPKSNSVETVEDEDKGTKFAHPPSDNRPPVRVRSRPARVIGSFDHPILPMPPVCHTSRPYGLNWLIDRSIAQNGFPCKLLIL